MNWQEDVAKELIRVGFQRGRYNPCLYYHPGRCLRTLLHDDDFATVGDRQGVQLLKTALENRFEITYQCIGQGVEKSLEVAGAGSGSGPAPTTT